MKKDREVRAWYTKPSWVEIYIHVGGQFFRIIPLKIEFSSQPRQMLLFLTTKIAAVTSRAKLAPVVQKMDIGIQWINIRESNCAILRIKIYPVDSAIHLLNNWGQQ